jgi:DNA-binding MarR family transcriptional regulator
MSELEDNISEREDNGDADHVSHVIEQWARVRPDLDTAPIGVIARLGRASAYVDAGIGANLAEFGLTRNSWDVLASLRRTGPPHRLSPTALYQSLMRSSGAMTHRLTELEQAGLVKRVPDPEDGRGMLVELTRKGLGLVDRAAPAHLATERALLAALNDDEQAALAALLSKLLRDFEQRQPIPPPSGRGGRRKASASRRARPR